MKFSQICMDQCYFFHCLCTQHSCINRSDCPKLNKQKMMHGWIFWYITKMMQAITYVITSVIRFNYLIQNIDFTHSNLIVRKMNKEFLHEKLTMFTSAQHMSIWWPNSSHTSRACLKSQQPLLLLCLVVIPISKYVKLEHLLFPTVYGSVVTSKLWPSTPGSSRTCVRTQYSVLFSFSEIHNCKFTGWHWTHIYCIIFV